MLFFEILGFLLLILVAAEVFVNALEHLGEKLKISEGVTGSLFAAVGTALPETLVPLLAIFAGTSNSKVNEEIGVGAILGAPLMLSTLSLFLMSLAVLKKRGREGHLMPERTGLKRRSVVVPVKAVLMNLLSVGAAYGALVLVFQEGGPAIGETIANALGFTQVQAIEPWLPLFLFSVLFGLSMDYHVFLLSRIREEYDKTGDNSEAVAYGLRTTGGIITGAAIIMVAVFTAFAAGRLVMLQQMGLGLAVAVFMDATIVRSVLVPSSMKLLGDRNWYLPTWLEWLPRVNVEGHEPPHEAVVVPETEVVGAGEER